MADSDFNSQRNGKTNDSLSLVFFQALAFGFCSLPPDVMTLLNDMPASELTAITDYVARRGGITVSVDAVLVRRALAATENQRRAEDVMRKFIDGGASSPMMFSLFRLSRAQVKTLREKWNCPQPRGRVQVLPYESMMEIWVAWHGLGEQDIRAKYLALQALFPALSMGMLWQAVQSERDY